MNLFGKLNLNNKNISEAANKCVIFSPFISGFRKPFYGSEIAFQHTFFVCVRKYSKIVCGYLKRFFEKYHLSKINSAKLSKKCYQ
jgi:hypothetical protein